MGIVQEKECISCTGVRVHFKWLQSECRKQLIIHEQLTVASRCEDYYLIAVSTCVTSDNKIAHLVRKRCCNKKKKCLCSFLNGKTSEIQPYKSTNTPRTNISKNKSQHTLNTQVP